MKKDITEEKQKHLNTIGQNIRRIRTDLKMSQEQLANLCGHTNDNARSWISKIESGTNDPPASDLKLIAKALGVTCLELMKESGEDEEKKKACELFEQCYGSEVFKVVQKFLKLDHIDRIKAEERIETLLDSDKYAVKKESSKDVAM